jgi:anti-sigma regulatory factor (Ser/Thr protein kinase)
MIWQQSLKLTELTVCSPARTGARPVFLMGTGLHSPRSREQVVKGRTTTLHNTVAAPDAGGGAQQARPLQRVSVELPFDASLAIRGRQVAVDALAGTSAEPLLDTVVLVCSELVTNGLLHGSAPVRLDLTPVHGSGGGPALEVTVTDGGRAEHTDRTPVSADPPDESGRGRTIVAAVADASSLTIGPTRTTAWCRLLLDALSPTCTPEVLSDGA